MKKSSFLVIMSLMGLAIFAQEGPRLMEIPPNQTPVPGQSLYAFTVKMRSGRSVMLTIDDIKIGHFFDGENAEIAVPNGRHIVRAYQMEWDRRNSTWKDDDDDRLTDTLTGEKYEVEVANGPKLRGRRKTRLAYDNPAAPRPAAAPVQPVQPVQPARTTTSTTGIEGAVVKASEVFAEELPRNSTIAVLSVSSNNVELATFAVDELEYQLVLTKRFTVVDRTTLDKIRSEQAFQLSGDVSDQSAVSIGNMLGASIVITGTISGSGNTQRLTLKALDVKTAQIITMAREQF
jgi:TolB-like protein